MKAGKSKPYFGLNIDDHTSFIRGGNINRKFGLDKEGSIFSPYQKPVNIIEVGLNFSEISIITSIANNFIGYNSSNIGFLGMTVLSLFFFMMPVADLYNIKLLLYDICVNYSSIYS